MKQSKRHSSSTKWKSHMMSEMIKVGLNKDKGFQQLPRSDLRARQSVLAIFEVFACIRLELGKA